MGKLIKARISQCSLSLSHARKEGSVRAQEESHQTRTQVQLDGTEYAILPGRG